MPTVTKPKPKPKGAARAHALAAGGAGAAGGAPPAAPGFSPHAPPRARGRPRTPVNPAFPRYGEKPVAALIAYPNNPRTHTPAQVRKLAASIEEFGFTNPVLTDGKRGIVAGHGRVLAAQMLGMTTVPVIELSHLTEAQRRAYIIADNKLALDAGWDEELLALELGELRAGGFDLALTGFGAAELSDIFGAGNAGLTDPDAAPGLPVRPVSRPGDVWLLGEHRLVCGDATVPQVVALALGTAKPHLMVTDPPYGVEYDANWRNEALRADGSANDGRAIGVVDNDAQFDWTAAWKLFPGSVAYVWHADRFCAAVAASLAEVKLALRAQIVWVKQRHVIGRGDYHFQHEPLLYTVREGEPDHWHFVPEHELAAYVVKAGAAGQYHGGRKQSTVWFIEHIKSETGHSTQKPVECMKRPMENNSRPGDAVYDPFIGSGTSIIAAEMSGRACIGIEISPSYVDVAVKRWQAFRGQDAVHGFDGRSFDVIEAERLG